MSESVLLIYGSVLQGVLALIAVIGVFLAFILQHKIDYAVNALESVTSENWEQVIPETSQKHIDAIFDMYEKRLDFAKPSKTMQLSVALVLVGCVSSCSLSLYDMIRLATAGKFDLLYVNIVAVLTIAIAVAVGFLSLEILRPQSGFVFKLDKRDEVQTASYLRKRLSMDPRTIVEKIGLIRIGGVIEPGRSVYVEFCNHLLKEPMSYRVILKSRGNELVVQNGSLEKNVYGNFVVRTDDFPPLSNSRDQWQLWFEIYTLPADFANFNAVRYVFEARTGPTTYGKIVFFDQTAVAYLFPERKYSEEFTFEGGWFWSSKEWPHLVSGEPSFVRRLSE